MAEKLLHGRPTVAEIDLKALEYNYTELRKRIPKGVKFLAVVKADAYGHGAVPISLKLERLGVDYLGVAISEEGEELRKAGVKVPILVLGGVFKGDLDRVFRFRLTPVVFSEDSLSLLSNEAKRRRKRIKVHLKVDTGMGRLGIPINDYSKFLERLDKLPEIEIEGILSHFSMLDEDEDYTRRQWGKFQLALEMTKNRGFSYKYYHIASSGTMISYPEYCGNLVRPGIMLYGAYPSNSYKKLIKLRPLMTLKTAIHYLKWVSSGERISYGGTFVTNRLSKIATIPIGYGDGYSRFLSNKGEVLIHGRRAPIVGRICMDFFMVDVTDVPNVRIGDEVILIGKQGRERITVEEIAEKIGSIPYEVLCLIGKRVPRVYLD